jgi:hypothetical protein
MFPLLATLFAGSIFLQRLQPLSLSGSVRPSCTNTDGRVTSLVIESPEQALVSSSKSQWSEPLRYVKASSYPSAFASLFIAFRNWLDESNSSMYTQLNLLSTSSCSSVVRSFWFSEKARPLTVAFCFLHPPRPTGCIIAAMVRQSVRRNTCARSSR